jgi:hypothetical protein
MSKRADFATRSEREHMVACIKTYMDITGVSLVDMVHGIRKWLRAKGDRGAYNDADEILGYLMDHPCNMESAVAWSFRNEGVALIVSYLSKGIDRIL